MKAAESLRAAIFIAFEVVDLRSLNPLDFDTIHQSITKTNKALLLQEPSSILGPISEVAALIMEQSYEHLFAPVLHWIRLSFLMNIWKRAIWLIHGSMKL